MDFKIFSKISSYVITLAFALIASEKTVISFNIEHLTYIEPCISHSCKKIAFTMTVGDSDLIEIADSNGCHLNKILAFNRIKNIQWSADDSMLVFAGSKTHNKNKSESIWSIKSNGTRLKHLTKSIDGESVDACPCFTKEGKNIVWTHMD
jgi:Tol biopolymer transport system component